MKVVLQKVSKAQVECNGETRAIEKGYCLLVGVSNDSTINDALKLAEKIAASRNFEDEQGKINKSIQSVDGEILSISQFTLYADVKKGNRPSFTKSAKQDHALELYNRFNEHLRAQGLHVKEGFFGGMMDVTLCNEGPITIIYESVGGSIV